MLDFGFVILLLGCVLLMWLKLGARAEMKSLTPRPVLLRNSAIEDIKVSRKRGYAESYVLIALGCLIILIAGVVN